MHLDPYIVLGSAVVGLLVGLTGAGGGALMTPMLILLFGVKPSSAISSDLVAAVVMRPVGAAVHLYKKTVNLRLVGWMVCGSVPMAFVGAFLLHKLGNTSAAQANVEKFLGAALLIGAAAMVFRYYLDRRSGQSRIGLMYRSGAREEKNAPISTAGTAPRMIEAVTPNSTVPKISAPRAAAAVSGTACVRSVPTSALALISG